MVLGPPGLDEIEDGFYLFSAESALEAGHRRHPLGKAFGTLRQTRLDDVDELAVGVMPGVALGIVARGDVVDGTAGGPSMTRLTFRLIQRRPRGLSRSRFPLFCTSSEQQRDNRGSKDDAVGHARIVRGGVACVITRGHLAFLHTLNQLRRTVIPVRRAALAGAVAAGLGLGVSELLAGTIRPFPSLVEGLGNWVIDNAPTPVKDFAIETFGTADKLVLLIGIAAFTVAIGAATGVLARDRFPVAIGVFAGFGVAAALAVTAASDASLGVAIVPGTGAALVGLWSLDRLNRWGSPGSSQEADLGSRRAFLLGAGAVFGLAALSAATGRWLIEGAKRTAAAREEVALPIPAQLLPEVPAAAELGVPGLSPVITPNDDFYRIDTAFSVPLVDIQSWTLSVTGRVDRPYTIDFFDLADMRMVERDITLACVSNPVGGDLVDNARWQGVPLSEILNRAGVRSDAEQLVGRSVDGFTVGFPVEAAFDGREALVAVGMNGEPLPLEHGFPARLVVAGLYGYVSATKWLAEIELTGWDEFDAYWVPRGWAKEAPIKTQSRIDTPVSGQTLAPGIHTVAGVAWAQTRGISRVEVQLGEDQPWVDAELSEPLSVNSWVQWKVSWEATPGSHRIRVRATDGEGATQDEMVRPAAPDGATGWHTRQVVVS